MKKRLQNTSITFRMMQHCLFRPTKRSRNKVREILGEDEVKTLRIPTQSERIFWRVNTRPNELNVTSPYASATGLFGAHCAALRLSPATEPLPKETGART
ncbi:NinE family protein [Sodalis glossinidius]|uniref:NinE family protein n=1 Tax=Sodalis glossinidius TaxID=63612 RepID=UPI000323A492|nr:NinE family protein [Sodalis glossinidius]